MLKAEMRGFNKRRTGVIAVAAVMLCAACNVTRKYEKPVVTQKVIRDNAEGDTNTLATMTWNSLVSDRKLAALLSQAVDNNYNYNSALRRINIARSTYLQSGAALLPTVAAQLSAADNKTSAAANNIPSNVAVNLETQSYRAQISTAWEADIWGRLSSAKRANLASLMATTEAAKAVKLQLATSVASTYFQLMALDEQLKITRRTIANRAQYVKTLNLLKEAAVVNGAAVVSAEANLRAAEVLVPDLVQNIRQAENALSILTGRPAGPVDRDSLYSESINVDVTKTGVSAQLLRYRPDVAQAEYNLRAAFENVNFAQASFYPALSLSATGGLSSLTLANFFNKSVFYNLIANLTQPIVNGRQNRTRLEIARENREIALNTFQQSLLQAGAEVSNYLSAYNTAVQREELRRMQIESLTKAVSFTKQLLEYTSTTNYNDVLVSEQNLLTAQLNAVGDRLARLQAVIQLYTALGGGAF